MPTTKYKYQSASDKLEESRNTEFTGYRIFRQVRDFTMSGLILAMAVIMLLGNYISFTKAFVVDLDPILKYLFGGLCLIYGSFRLYRAIKPNY